MIKRTLLFQNPSYLSTKNEQIVITFPKEELPIKTVPIEDVGIILLENQQITFTNGLLSKLVQNNVIVISCDSFHMPTGIFQPLVGNSVFNERVRIQLDVSQPLKKNLWQQTVQAKIINQANFLEENEVPARRLYKWANEVKSGDVENHESRAAKYYWERIYNIPNFVRGQKEQSPNNLLNYGYAVLRAITARALIGSGMLPGVGIFHHNKYNAFCLADDIMEPYRVYVDVLVNDILNSNEDIESLNTELKTYLLKLPTMDVMIDGKKSPLLIAMSRTTNSLFNCFEGTSRKLLYPIYK